MRIYVADFAGHPFQSQLSRKLAEYGFFVRHAFSEEYASGKGNFKVEKDLESQLSYIGLSTGITMNKYDIKSRFIFEINFARIMKSNILQFKPDVIIFCNIPLLSMYLLSLNKKLKPFIFWHQDIYSMPIEEEIKKRFKLIGNIFSGLFSKMEKTILKKSSHIVPISQVFTPFYQSIPIDHKKITVIENWAPLTEIVPKKSQNSWSNRNIKKTEALQVVYSGTLGRKHNPQLLLDFAVNTKRAHINLDLTVIAEGDGADWLRRNSSQCDNIKVLSYQPYELFSEVLSSFDLALVILETNASKFSIPSKVLSHLSAGNAVIGLLPKENPAAILIENSGNFVSTPDSFGISQAVGWLSGLTATNLRTIGKSSRKYAEENFAIEEKIESFIKIITGVHQ